MLPDICNFCVPINFQFLSAPSQKRRAPLATGCTLASDSCWLTQLFPFYLVYPCRVTSPYCNTVECTSRSKNGSPCQTRTIAEAQNSRNPHRNPPTISTMISIRFQAGSVKRFFVLELPGRDRSQVWCTSLPSFLGQVSGPAAQASHEGVFSL